MRAAILRYVLACMLTILCVGCRAGDPVGPEPALRETAPAGDPCNPNLSPC
jgi:hypothetical protein